MKRFWLRMVLVLVFVVLALGLTGCETSGYSTMYVGVHGGYGYGPGWGMGGAFYPGRPYGPYW